MSETRYDLPNYQIRHREHDGTYKTDLFPPENLSYTLNKGENGAHDVQYEISRSRDIVFPAFVIPYETDFELWRGDIPMVSGMITGLNISSDQDSIQIAGKSYLEYLNQRQWPFDASDPNLYRFGPGLSSAPDDIPPTGYSYALTTRDVALVVKDMLDVIKLDANCLDFTYVLPAMGIPVESFSIGLPDTEYIYSKITTLSQQDPGEFDFWMDFNKVFRIAAPRRYDIGVYNDETLAEHIFDDSLQESGFHKIDFGNTGPKYTWLLGQGSSTQRPSTLQYVPGSEQFRRIDGNESYPTIQGSTRVAKLTRKSLLFGLNGQHELSLQVVPEKIYNFWNRFAPGKAIWVKADLDGWRIDSAQEIVSMEITSDLSGNETCTFKLNQIYQSSGITIE